MSRTIVVSMCIAVGALFATVASATDAASLESRYAGAAELAASGATERALDQLAPLADERPDSVAVHRAIGLLAVQSRREAVWRQRFTQRLRLTARDVGANVGLAVLEAARGNRTEAHRLAMTALTAESRDPLLVPLLLDTADDPDALIAWMRQRQAVLPHDPLFAAALARMMLARDRVAEARSVLLRAIETDPEHPDLTLLYARVLVAAGEERHACELATLGSGHLLERDSPAESRIPDRVALARTLIACGLLAEAEGVLVRMGSRAAIGMGKTLDDQLALAEAELRVASGQPIAAIEVLSSRGDAFALSPDAREAALAIRARAAAATGSHDDGLDTALRTPPPRGLAIGDRAMALAALTSSRTRAAAGDRGSLAEQIGLLEDAARRAGFTKRADRLALLARAEGSVRAPRVLPADSDEGPSPALRVADAIVSARAALAAAKPADALTLASFDALAVIGAPGQLAAALRLVAAEAALAHGERDRALEFVRDGLLDVQEADRARTFVAPEYASIAGDPTETALALAGVGLRAAAENGANAKDAGSVLLRQLGRAARSWSVLETGWNTEIDDLMATVPARTCLVIATLGADAPRVVIGPGGAIALRPASDALSGAECAGARSIAWLGPATAPGGLTPAPNDRRVVVRLVGPSRVETRAVPDARTQNSAGSTVVGEGPSRPQGAFVSALARRASVPEVETRDRTPGEPAFAYVGTGLALASAPLASGWFVPPGGDAEPGWLGPESILAWPPTQGGGLVAAGVARLPESPVVDRGSWVLAESALVAGRSWVLISTRPLSAEEWGRLESELPSWRENPLDAALDLARDQPELASHLALWSAPGHLPQPSGPPWGWIIGASLLLLVLAGTFTLRRLVARRARTKGAT